MEILSIRGKINIFLLICKIKSSQEYFLSHQMSRAKKNLRVRIDDEAYLHTLVDISLSRPLFFLYIIAALAVAIIIGGSIIMLTPLRTLLPGYMKEEQRYATEENLLRLDSLRTVYDNNQAYIDNFLLITDTDRIPEDSASRSQEQITLHDDSLAPPAKREQKFVKAMNEREKFNISVLAPLAADGMMFNPVADRGVFSENSKHRETAEIILAADASLLALADGRVLSSYYSPSDHGYVIALQHPRGFASLYTSTGTPLVESGDLVTAGQIIASAPKADAKGRRMIKLRMWHNTHAIIPFNYIGTPLPNDNGSPGDENLFESPRGRL